MYLPQRNENLSIQRSVNGDTVKKQRKKDPNEHQYQKGEAGADIAQNITQQ